MTKSEDEENRLGLGAAYRVALHAALQQLTTWNIEWK